MSHYNFNFGNATRRAKSGKLTRDDFSVSGNTTTLTILSSTPEAHDAIVELVQAFMKGLPEE